MIMWNLFKLTNLLWLFISTYWWVTAGINQGVMLVIINILMIFYLTMLPIKINLTLRTGIIEAIIILITLWYNWIDGAISGLIVFLMYMPVQYLLQLPINYKKDLLSFTTKWYSILISISLILYWASLFTTVPSIGIFNHPPYPPFSNHVFFIESTFDYGFFPRFNAFFLEPGHQAILSTFMMIANRFNFRQCPWLWPLALSVIFSFSLAGYILLFIGFCLLKVNTIWKALAVGIFSTIVIVTAINFTGGNNALNDLIISRLEKDDNQGIKGNNRFYNDTDFVFTKAVKNENLLMGVKNSTNMEMVGGAGYKIFIINYGLIGVFLALMLYLSIIPQKPDWRYTLVFVIILCLCFLQRAYPVWYSWLFPYIMGIYIAKGEHDEKNHTSDQLD